MAQLVKDVAHQEGPGVPAGEGDGREARVRDAAAGRCASQGSFPPGPAGHPRSPMTDYAPFPLIDLSGSPRERGRMHGKAAADRLRRGAKMYAESLLKSGVDWKELERRAEAMVPAIETVRSGLCRGDARHRRGRRRAVRRRRADERPHRDGGGGAPAAGGASTSRTAARRRWRCPRRAPTACCCMARTGTGAPSAPRPASCCASAATTARTS